MPPWHMDGNETPLKAPRTPREKLLRDLALAAMSITHHDASEHEDGFIHEVRYMEIKFAAVLRGKLKTKWSPKRPRVPATQQDQGRTGG